VEVRKELYIGGRWTAPQSSGDIAVVDSRTEEPMGSVPRGAAAEVEKAVTAARTAFPAWAASSVADGWRRCERSPTAWPPAKNSSPT
jgi:aldehyde dehydrogenase (NAD+)